MVLIDAVLRSMLDDFELVVLQPEASAIASNYGERGGGFRGVIKWCEAVGARGGPDGDPAFETSAAVIVHVDGDVATEPEFNCSQSPAGGDRPCGPNAVAIRACLEAKMTAGHARLVFCVPHQATESWLLAMFRGAGSGVELLAHPANSFAGGLPKLCRYQDGKLKKVVARYQEQGPEMIRRWPSAVAACGEARQFDSDLRSRL